MQIKSAIIIDDIHYINFITFKLCFSKKISLYARLKLECVLFSRASYILSNKGTSSGVTVGKLD